MSVDPAGHCRDGWNDTSASSLPSPIVFCCCFVLFFGNERGLDLKVSCKFSSILGMLTPTWGTERKVFTVAL